MASELQSQILHKLDESSTPINSSDTFPDVESTVIKGAIDSLGSREMIEFDTIDREEAVLTPEGIQIATEGSHEARVFDAVKAMGGLKIKDLAVSNMCSV